MKVVSKYLRENGIILSNYGDDSMIIGDSFQDCLKQRDFVAETFEKLGLQRQDSKGQWSPSQIVHFLGMLINAKEQRIFIPKTKMKELYSFMGIISLRKKLSRRTLARVAVKFNSLKLSFLPTRFFARTIYQSINMEKKMHYPNWCWNHCFSWDFVCIHLFLNLKSFFKRKN